LSNHYLIFNRDFLIMLIELHKITKRYDDNIIPVLDNISLRLSEGSAVAVVGPSGSGKSTLLNLVGTLDFPTSGEVLFNRITTSSLTSDELAKLRNNSIGFVFQTHLLLPQLTVMENVLLPVIPQDKNQQKQAPGRACRLLDTVGLSDKTHRFPGELSVGECQRVAIVRALINEPELLLADEPTGSLDHDSAEILSDMIMELRRQYNFTLVAVTHSPDLAKRMEITYKLVNGRITAN
jgi:lipoprotein-releasing system ATP-binding protein